MPAPIIRCILLTCPMYVLHQAIGGCHCTDDLLLVRESKTGHERQELSFWFLMYHRIPSPARSVPFLFSFAFYICPVITFLTHSCLSFFRIILFLSSRSPLLKRQSNSRGVTLQQVCFGETLKRTDGQTTDWVFWLFARSYSCHRSLHCCSSLCCSSRCVYYRSWNLSLSSHYFSVRSRPTAYFYTCLNDERDCLSDPVATLTTCGKWRSLLAVPLCRCEVPPKNCK